jgi:hypothetical protein
MRELVKKMLTGRDNEGVSYATAGVLKATVFFRCRAEQRRSEEIYTLISRTPTLSCKASLTTTQKIGSSYWRDEE